jgi:ketose-bisphosphate aldolase
MTIAAIGELLANARHDGYAVGYFESWDIYSLEAVVAAAEAERSPVILGIGGLTANHAWLRERGIALYGHAAQMLARAATVPAAVMFNEGDSLEECRLALNSGYNAVMMVGAGLSLDRLVSDTATLTNAAHRVGVSVEGELDELAEMRDGEVHDEGSRLTDVDRAVEFVAATGVDCLAASVGSVHFVTGGFSPTIELDLIRRLAAAVDVPLVLHGGSGVAPDQLRAAVAAGIAKVNFGTRLKYVFGSGLRAALAHDGADPNLTYGSRLDGDALGAAARDLTEEVRRYMQILGSSGKAVGR